MLSGCAIHGCHSDARDRINCVNLYSFPFMFFALLGPVSLPGALLLIEPRLMNTCNYVHVRFVRVHVYLHVCRYLIHVYIVLV